MATTFSRSKFGPDEPRRTPTNSGELRSWVISEIWFLFFSWLVLTYHKATHSAWMPKFLPSCYQQGRGQGHTLCSRNPLFPTNHVAREKDQVKLSHVDRFWPMQEMTVSVWGVLWVPGSFLACSLIGLPEGRALMTPSPLIEIVFHEIWIDYSKPPKDRHAIDHSFWHSFVF